MGASESVIVNHNDVKLQFDAGEIEVDNKCRLTLCSPDIETFEDKTKDNKEKEILILVIIMLLFISLLFIKRT